MKVETIKGAAGLHPRNKHRGNYDFAALSQAEPPLKAYIKKNPKGEDTIDFAQPLAVKLLNKALLAHYYGIHHWNIPEGFLCPPIPGRADYIHRIAELLYTDCPQLAQQSVRMLDVGVGANCIYPIIAAVEYGWHAVGSDIDPLSVKNAATIVQENGALTGQIDCRLQPERRAIFKDVILPDEFYNVTTCNPPFHSSLEEAQRGTQRKLANLKKNQQKRGRDISVAKEETTILNFGGQKAELWCPGGELAFLQNMARESADFAQQVLWFSSLISKKENIRPMKKQLKQAGAVEVKIIEMTQGQKISRLIAWSFLDERERQKWPQKKAKTVK